MSALYVPPTDESDHKKQNQSLQLIGGITSTNTDNVTTNTADISTNTTNISTNTSDIATLTANGATYVVGPASATANGFAVYNGTTGKLVKDHAATIALASEVSGTLPVANGGTGDTGTAWSSYTPTFGSTTGTATVSGKQKTIGKTVFVNIITTFTSAVTGTFTVTLPTTAKNNSVISGKEIAVGGLGAAGIVLAASNSLSVLSSAGGQFTTNAMVIVLTGSYESS
jgi:hypothetical protein